MIIPRQYFDQQVPQARMQQAPMTSPPQRGTADTGAAQAEQTLYESLENVFGKLTQVAGKIKKTNEDLEFQEQKVQLETEIDQDYEIWRTDHLPNYKWENLNPESVRDHFVGDSQNMGPWGKDRKYSDSDRLNRKLKVHAQAYQQRTIKQAIGATMQERKDRINILLDEDVNRLVREAQERIIGGQDVDPKTYIAEHKNTFKPLVDDGAVGKKVYQKVERSLVDQIQKTRAIMAFTQKPKVWAKKSFKDVKANFPGADPTDLFDLWHTHSEADKKSTFDFYKELIADPNTRPSDIDDRLKETVPAYRQLDTGQKEKLERLFQEKQTNYLQNRELQRLRVNVKDSAVFRGLVKLNDKGKTIVDDEAVRKVFKNDQRINTAIGIVEQHIQSNESLKQRRALEETGKIENKLNSGDWDYETIQERINNNSDMEELDKIRLRGFLGEKHRVRNNQEGVRFLSNFLSDEANQETFLQTYKQITNDTGNIRPDDELGELGEQRLVKEIKRTSPGDLQSLYLQAKGDFKESARQGTLATFRKNLSLATTSSGVQQLIEGLEKRPESIRFEDHQNWLATLNQTKANFKAKEDADNLRITQEKQQTLQLKQRNQIQQTKNSKSLMTEDDINGLETEDGEKLTEFQKEYLKGIRGLKQIELDTKFETEQDSINFQKTIQEALKAETLEEFQTIKAKVETLIGNRVNAEQLNTTLQKMETGLEDQIETKESNKIAKQQNVNYTGLEQAIRNVTDQEGVDKIKESLAILKVYDNDKGDVTRVQQLLLEGSLKATQDNLTDRLSQPDSDADSAFSGRISELADQATQSKQIAPIMSELEERAKVFQGDIPGWFYRLRSGVKTRRRQLRTKEQSDSLVNFAHNKWQEYRAMDPAEKRKKYPLMERDDFVQANRIAHNQWDLATPNYITSQVEIGNHLNNHANWLTTKIFNPDTEVGNPLLARDKEGFSLETRIGENRISFTELEDFSYDVQKGIKEVITLTTDVSVNDKIKKLEALAGGNKHKKTMLGPFLDIANERVRKLQTAPKDTAVEDHLLLFDAGQSFDESTIDQSKWYQTDRVIDGDTLIIGDQRIRLANVNTAELGTPEGEEAAEAVTDLLSKRKIRLEVFGKGQYGRGLAHVWIDDRTMLQEWLIRNGYSGYMKHWGPGTHHEKLQQAARSQ